MPSTRVARLAALAGLLCALLTSTAQAETARDPVLINPARYTIKVGRYSRLAQFQANLHRALDECGDKSARAGSTASERIGQFTPAIASAIRSLTHCRATKNLPANSPARHGQLTVAIWRAVMGDAPPPSVDERARSMILSFEATDFGDPPEWNLCQDGTRAQFGPSHRNRGTFRCFNASDPCSYMTWGPRGATAGSGREVQYVLWMAGRKDPDALKQAFGDEYANVRRFIHLKGSETEDCREPSPVKRFICAVWVDDARRRIWEQALASLGQSSIVRQAYDDLYSFLEFDGEKLNDYYKLWAAIGLQPTETDYAFFLDRITHQGGPPDEIPSTANALNTCIASERGQLTRNAAARRCLSHIQPHKTQARLRLARDVGYYLDGYVEGAMTSREIDAWGGYIPLSAEFNFGLSDAVQYPVRPSASVATLGPERPVGTRFDITPEEMQSCPAQVLSPIRSSR